MNLVILTGRLCNDPELRYTQSGTPVASYRLAVDRPKRDGKSEADFLNCITWRANAEFASKYLRKGMKIAVEGRIQTGSYEKNGVKQYTTDIIVERHEFCESKGSTFEPTEEQRDKLNALNDYVDKNLSPLSEMDDDGELPF